MDDEERQRREAHTRLLAERAAVYGERVCACGCGRKFRPGSRPGRRYFSDRCGRRDYARRHRRAEREATS